MNTVQQVQLHAIGVINSPFRELDHMPVQSTGDSAQAGWVELRPELAEGMKDLEGFSHLILIYHLHRAASARLTVVPFLDKQEHGIFATRAPVRPNPIGLSVVAVDRIEGTRIHIRKLDILDGTPLLDLKPFVPAFDVPAGPVRSGWMEASAWQTVQSDSRFKLAD
ncbi:MAG: hypothetical protein K0R57_323 [Paenibacillaceae bacterium]|jgi:tRNA-Thr(GGU) m(6)t(6)A37 methyltransferase TsaA|nr:hypothetical protein [Paenibacillaceae bacterium]